MAEVQSVEMKTTKTNKPYKAATLTDGRKVNVWSDHPVYMDCDAGYVIPDNMIYQKGQYWNLSNPGQAARKGAATRANNQRSAQIKEAQDRKEDSITFFNATNAAINLVGHEHQSGTADGDLKMQITMWRDWFIEEHKKYKERKNFAAQFPENEDPIATESAQNAPEQEKDPKDVISPEDIPF